MLFKKNSLYGGYGIIIPVTIIFLVVFVFLNFSEEQDNVALIKEGQAYCSIIVDAESGPSVKFAAKELAYFLHKMSGATINIYNTPSRGKKTDNLIFIGQKAVGISCTGLHWDKLGTDGYIIKTIDSNKLIIAGGEKRGTLYGVYTFLESLGCRWWTPSESTIPEKKTIIIPRTYIYDTPELIYRDIMFRYTFDPDGQLWCARNKINGMAWENAPENYGNHYKFVGNLVHSYMTLLKKSGHQLKPEMMAEVNGKRLNPNGFNVQPCLSNPDTIKAMADGVLKAYKENPDAHFVVVGQEDNGNYCRCEKCAAIDAKEGSHAGQVIYFANKVAEEVEKKRPGSAICTAAYRWSRKPPLNLKPRHNVYITLSTIECDFAHPIATAKNKVNTEFRQDMKAWGKIAPRMYIWDYVVNYRHHLMPFPNLYVMPPNIKFFSSNGVWGVFEQGAHKARGTEFYGLRMWILAKILWNPDADGVKTIEEFVRGYYGSAGPSIMEYIDSIHEPGRNEDFEMGIYTLLAAPYITPDVISGAETVLQKAEKAVSGNPVLEKRVRHAHMPVWYILAKRGPASLTWKTVESKNGTLDITAIADRFTKVVEENNIYAIADGEVIEPWLQWLNEYAAHVQKKGIPVPPELKKSHPSSYFLTQACQMDGRGRWYEKHDGASDGWVVQCPTPAWTITSALDEPDHFRKGKKYKLFVRAKGKAEQNAKGNVWTCGIWRDTTRKAPVNRRFDADVMREDKWNVFEIGEWEPEEGDTFYIALLKPEEMKKVYLDCFWLQEAGIDK